MAYKVETGRVVISKAGRDSGRRYIVTSELDTDFVMVADGVLRGINRQKKKRRKHLKPLPYLDTGLREKLVSGAAVNDCELRSCLSKEEGK